MKTETAERILEMARQILQDVKAGLSHSQDRIDWAKSILTANMWPRKA